MLSDEFTQTCARTTSRVRAKAIWFPLPFFLTPALLFLLLGHVFFQLNFRVRSHPDVITLPNLSKSTNPSIWLSLQKKGDHLWLSTRKGALFKIDPTSTDISKTTTDITRYLEERLEQIRLHTILANKFTEGQSKIIFALDRNVQFEHFNIFLPILEGLGISTYSFEVATTS